MKLRTNRLACFLSLSLVFISIADATSVPSMTFEELTDRSEIVVSGQVARSWSEWDSEHKFIWTHHELSVSGVHKGTPGSKVVVSEPGGVVGTQGMSVAGSVVYQPADRVFVFLQRMPNGYLRTTGWGQGKYTVDAKGRLHAETSFSGGFELVGPQSLRSLDGMTVADVGERIAARMRLQGGAR
jgi:hypothetical protein